MDRQNHKKSPFRIRLNLQQKLLGGFLAVILISVIVSIVSSALQTRVEQTRAQVNAANQLLMQTQQVMMGINNIEAGFRGYMITGETVFMDEYTLAHDETETALAGLDALTQDNQKLLNRWKTIRGQISAWDKNWTQPGITLRDSVTTGTATLDEVVEYEMRAGGKMYTDLVQSMITESQTEAQAVLAEAEAAHAVAQKVDNAVKLWGNVFGAGLGIWIAIWLARTISRALRQMVVAAQQIAQGEVDQTLDYHSSDEIGQLADAFRQMIAYIQAMAHAADKLADSDLSVRVRPRSERDVLGRSFRRMTDNLRSLIERLNQNILSLSTASGELAVAADQTSQATAQISATIQQVAYGANQQTESATTTAAATDQMGKAIASVAGGAVEQAKAVNRASTLAEQLNQSIQQLASASQNSAEESANAAQAAEQGVQVIGKALQAMQTIHTKVSQSAEKVNEMGARTQQIETIVSTIDEIASQTNLLALNAAIEAAHAGEHGKGFAVVADEVRKLAERSSTATKEINALIHGIEKSMTAATKSMDEGVHEVQAGSQLAGQSGEALASIQKTVKTVSEKARQGMDVSRQATTASEQLVEAMDIVRTIAENNTAAAEQMAGNTERVSQAIENIASVSEENSASVQEISASSEEMSAQANEVSVTAQSFTALADDLRQMVAQYNLESDGSAPETDDYAMEVHAEPAYALATEEVAPVVLPVVTSGNGNGAKANGHSVPIWTQPIVKFSQGLLTPFLRRKSSSKDGNDRKQ